MNWWQSLLIVFGLIVGSTVTPSLAQTNAAHRTLIVPSQPYNLHTAVPLPESIKVTESEAWQLVEFDHPQPAIQVQISIAAASDGSIETTNTQLLAIIPPREQAQGPRRFRLESVESRPPRNTSFEYREINKTSLGLWEREQPVFVYNHGNIIGENIPLTDHRRERACYIHPVWGLNGEILTDDFPKDHFHHHGIFWAWPHVEIGGQEHDLWMYDTIKQRFVRWLHRETGPLATTLAVENGWFVDDKQVMIERVWLRVFKASDDARVIDISLTWIPTEQAVTLQGAEGKSYGGLTIRFAPGSRQETEITVPSGRTDQDLPDTPLPWADLTAKFGGAETASGAALLVHPNHPDFPPTWLTRHYGPLCVGWPGVEPKTFPPGQSFQLNYRVWIHKSSVDLSRLNEVYEGYTASTQAAWE